MAKAKCVAISKRVVATYDIAYSFSLFRLPAAFPGWGESSLCESDNAPISNEQPTSQNGRRGAIATA